MESILILAFVALLLTIYSRAAGNPLEHSWAFRLRRFRNWLPLGLTYAFLYMGRYNLTVSKNAFGDLMSKADFGVIFAAGTITYAFSFLINGPLTDRIGGKRAILISSAGSAVMNAVMGIVTYVVLTKPDTAGTNLVLFFSIAYAMNMYFQSYGAVSIVKVNSNWFHVRERGSFGGMFGVLISLGIYFAFDWGAAVVDAVRIVPKNALSFSQNALRSVVDPVASGLGDQIWWVFFVPAGILATFFFLDIFLLRERPSLAGFKDLDTGDASSGESQEQMPVRAILKKILTNRVIWVIGSIEFCSGVLRNGVMHWYPIYAKETKIPKDFFFRKHWGKVLAIAGITGGMVAGFISDKVFGSRRGPVAALLYGIMVIFTGIMIFVLKQQFMLGTVVGIMSLAVIGVHGMLSGTATMDFGGRQAAGTAVGVIDGFVYLGTGVQSLALGWINSRDWSYWPVFMLPFALFGLMQALRIWKAFPDAKKKKK